MTSQNARDCPTRVGGLLTTLLRKYRKNCASWTPAPASVLIKLTSPHCDYKAVDLAIGDGTWNYDELDYRAPLDNLPIANNSFDAILHPGAGASGTAPRECAGVLSRAQGGREVVSDCSDGAGATPSAVRFLPLHVFRVDVDYFRSWF